MRLIVLMLALAGLAAFVCLAVIRLEPLLALAVAGPIAAFPFFEWLAPPSDGRDRRE